MKSKIPKSVIIGGHKYIIKIVDHTKLKSNEGGLMRYPQRHILIAKELSKELRWLTFLHEVFHGFTYEYGLTQIFGNQLAETTCEQFSSFIQSLQKQGVL